MYIARAVLPPRVVLKALRAWQAAAHECVPQCRYVNVKRCGKHKRHACLRAPPPLPRDAPPPLRRLIKAMLTVRVKSRPTALEALQFGAMTSALARRAADANARAARSGGGKRKRVAGGSTSTEENTTPSKKNQLTAHNA